MKKTKMKKDNKTMFQNLKKDKENKKEQKRKHQRKRERRKLIKSSSKS